MGRSRFDFEQVEDSEFASQLELDQVKDNNADPTLFVAQLMNNARLSQRADWFQAAANESGLYERAEFDFAVDDATRTFYIWPTGYDYELFINGVQHINSQLETVQFADSHGVWYFYFDQNNTLIASQTPWSFRNTAKIALLYWDTVHKKTIHLAYEAHDPFMDWSTHRWAHNTDHMKYSSGFDAGNYYIDGQGNLNTDAQFSLTGGVVYDEDIPIAVAHANTPVELFEQYLTPVARVPIWYRLNHDEWHKTLATDYAVMPGTARVKYNYLDEYTGGWSLQDAPSDNYYVAMFIYASSGIGPRAFGQTPSEPVVAVMGQNAYRTLNRARTYALTEFLDFGDLTYAEMKPIYRLIFQTNSAYTNAVKAKIVDVQDLRKAPGTLSWLLQGSVFGGNFNYAADEATTTTTSIYPNYVTKAQFTTELLEPGTYYVLWYFEWGNENNNALTYARVTDGTTTLAEISATLDSSLRNFPGAGSAFITVLTTETRTIKFEYCTEASNKPARLRRVRVAFWRIE